MIADGFKDLEHGYLRGGSVRAHIEARSNGCGDIHRVSRIFRYPARRTGDFIAVGRRRNGTIYRFRGERVANWQRNVSFSRSSNDSSLMGLLQSVNDR
jgi:hypothetical protein